MRMLLLGSEKAVYLRRRRRGRFARFLILASICAMTIFFSYGIFSKDKQTQLISPVSADFKAEILKAAHEAANPDNLKKAVENTLVGTKGNYGIVIKNLKTGESYFANEHKVFESGSLYKLWIMATVFSKIEERVLEDTEVLSRDIASLNRIFGIDSEVAELTEGSISLSIGNALNQMITISHNYAALLLTERIKLSRVAQFLKDKGFGESKVGIGGNVPVSTPADISLFFEKLYKGELAGQEYTDKMIDLLKNQKLNNKLPKNLPKEISIAHKTGELGWFSHDGGIVYTDKGDYIIVVMSESDKPAAAEDRIAQISEAVYQYFNRK